MEKRKITDEAIAPMETRFSIFGKFWLTYYNTNNQKETTDIKELYNLFVLSNPKQNDIDIGTFISVSKIRGVKTRRDKRKAQAFLRKTHQ